MSESNDFLETFEIQRAYKTRAKNTSASYRIKKLGHFKSLLIERKDDVANALKSDFGKPAAESDLTEIIPVVSMLNQYQRKLKGWMKDKRVSAPLLFLGSKSWIRHEARGNCLVISPWNYPFNLAAIPVLTSFAAGNTSILKPSEFTPATNKILRELFESVFTPEEVAVFEGDADLSGKLLELEFDHVFFTGSPGVGKIVAQAAAKNLASVSLELGGKSPCLVDRGADLDKFIERLAWGKIVNGGQTCVAPDYIVAFKEDIPSLGEKIIRQIQAFFPTGNFENNPDYCQIITAKHGQRLEALVAEAQSQGAKVLFGGRYHPERRVMEPTVVTNVSKSMRLMQEEIFGPILPVVGVNGVDEMIEFVKTYDNPLALYAFSENDKFHQKVLDSTFSGGVCLNDTLVHVAHAHLPFGGAGKSGIGKYHGKFGFEEFSHTRAVMKRKADLMTSYFYPPYHSKKVALLAWMLKRVSRLF